MGSHWTNGAYTMSQPYNALWPKRLLVAAIACAGIAVTSPAVYAQSGFWDSQNEGWFFYEPEPVEEEPPEENPPQVVPVEIDPPEPPEETPEPPEEPAYLSAVWLKDNLPRYHQAALDDPTNVQTVAVYAFLKRVALDKAEQFTKTYQQALLKYPVLDENTNRSTASFATKAMDQEADEAKFRLLREISNRSLGLFFFYEDDCEVCLEQTRPLNWVKRRGGFDVQPISLDGAPIPIKGYENFSVDEGQAEMLGLVATPAIYLVIDSQNIVSIGQGGTSAHALAEAIITQARMNGVISEEEFQSTQSSRLNPLGQSFNQLIESKSIAPREDGFIDPDSMYELIEEEISR
tara:strand:+ start:9040 stop:10083 length:1044 start_codon:yes stop_codon:yes gene_type:complete